jgi:NRAMP (natural resistance-associated macrophage protein)-like metal ion transporter
MKTSALTVEHRVRRFFHALGPGIVTGAADDDPSGISTYSTTGAAFGLSQLWTVFLTFPLMAAVQMMCARLALVTGEGLAGVIRRRYPRWVLWSACLLLAVANVVNIGADLAGMAEALEMVTGLPSRWCSPLLASGLLAALVWWRYRHLARTFKWITLVLFVYVIAAFLARPDWPEVLKATLVPHIQWNARYLATLVAILGTTITPYMFFWEASQEVEEERSLGRRTVEARRGATDEELRAARTDVLAGMAWASVAMYFIVLTTASTLHASGKTEIATARQAAEALRPLAGDAAYLLFALGLVGTGMLAVPVLAGSAAYAIAEALHWRGSLDDPPKVGMKFYAVLAVAILLGLALDLFEIDAIRALFYAAVINGILAPPLVAVVTLLTSDKKVMGRRVNPPWLRRLGWAAATIMLAAVVALGIATLA